MNLKIYLCLFICLNIVHGETGILVTPGDVFELAKEIECMILMSEEERRALGRKAKKMALGKFDIVENAKKMTDIYHHVLSNTPFS